MTSTAWGRRYRAFLRAHKIDINTPVEVKAETVRLWIEEQRTAWLESEGSLAFDCWLEECFPEPPTVTASWGNDREWGF